MPALDSSPSRPFTTTMLLELDVINSAAQSGNLDPCAVSDTSFCEAEVSNEPCFSAAGISFPTRMRNGNPPAWPCSAFLLRRFFPPAKTVVSMRLKVELYMGFNEELC